MCPGFRRWLWWVSSTIGTPKQSTGPQEITLACGSCSCQIQQRAPQPSPTGARPLQLLQNPPGAGRLWGVLWCKIVVWGRVTVCEVLASHGVVLLFVTFLLSLYQRVTVFKMPCAACLRLLIVRTAVLGLLLKLLLAVRMRLLAPGQ